jgi:acyl-coenzyme A synthetase/AMP-(fatty) acid ligase/aryl carrier-like protein
LLLEAGWRGSPLLKILVGGEACPRELANVLVTKGASVWNMYGPTETTIWSTTTRLQAGEGPVSIGRPIDNTQIYILGPNLQPTPIGVPGELLIGGDGLARGYLDRPDLTAEKFIADPFSTLPNARLYRTGDLARYLPSGAIECLGRIDHQVKVRGFRIELGEIETVLGQHPAVRENVVVAREDVPGQKRLVAYLSCVAGETPAIGDLRNYLGGKLPDYMVPSLFEFMEALPRTPNGKVNRNALPAPDAKGLKRDRVFVAPRNATEELLADIWGQVLSLDKVSVEDNLFELGADSIHLFQITARANQAELKLVPRQLLEHRTISALAVAIAAAKEPAGKAPAPAITRASRDAHRLKQPAV